MSAQEEAAGLRLVSAEEARQGLRDGWYWQGAELPLANTVVVQAEQISAVLAEHPTLQTLSGSDVWCGGCGRSWPCPTARALGVWA